LNKVNDNKMYNQHLQQESFTLILLMI